MTYNPNEKITCECGGKYANKNKTAHIKTRKHLDFIPNPPSYHNDLKILDRSLYYDDVPTDEEILELIAYEIEKLTITPDDMEYYIKDCKTVEQQRNIINSMCPYSKIIPAHLTGLKKSIFIRKGFDLWQGLKKKKYIYIPPNNHVVIDSIYKTIDEDFLI